MNFCFNLGFLSSLAATITSFVMESNSINSAHGAPKTDRNWAYRFWESSLRTRQAHPRWNRSKQDGSALDPWRQGGCEENQALVPPQWGISSWPKRPFGNGRHRITSSIPVHQYLCIPNSVRRKNYAVENQPVILGEIDHCFEPAHLGAAGRTGLENDLELEMLPQA